VVRGSFRVSAGEAEKQVAQKLEMGLTSLGLHSARNLGLLLHLLGLTVPEDALKGLDGVLIALSAVAGGDGDRGFALDRQRLGSIAHQDCR
jgi:hypothetical protein